MKLEITQKGAFGPDGEHEVGETITVKGDKIPGYLISKCRPVGRVAVTNPKDDAAPGGGKSPEREALEAKAKELGVKSAHLFGDEKLAQAVADAEAEAEAAKKAE